MKRLVALLFLGSALEFGISGQPAVGQAIRDATPSTTPILTPTAPPVLPSGRTLLRRMQAATDRFDTRREVDHLTIVNPDGAREVIDSITHVSTRSDRHHIFDIVNSNRPTRFGKSTRSESIMVGSLEATRAPGGVWDCVDWSKTLPGTHRIALTEDPSGIFRGQIQTLGASTVRAMPVWHVRIKVHEVTRGQDATDTSDTTDYFIAQNDDTLQLRKVRTTFRDSSGITRIYDVTHFSEYGRAFHIYLPKACKRFHAPLVPPLTPLFRSARRLLNSNEVHLVSHYRWSQRGRGQTTIVQQVDRLAHDAGYRMSLLKSVTGPGPHAVPTTIRQETIRLGNKIATWQAGHDWMCGVGPLSVPPHGLQRLPADAVVVALGSRSGSSAWQIHIRYPNRSGHTTLTATEELFISDFFRTRFVRSVYRKVDRSASPPIRESLAIDYSRYGEHLVLRLPTVCRWW